MSHCLLMAKWPKTEDERQGVCQFLRHLAHKMLVGIRPGAGCGRSMRPWDHTQSTRWRSPQSVACIRYQLADVALGRVAANEPVVSQVFVGHQAVEDVEYGHKDRVSDSAGRPGPEG